MSIVLQGSTSGSITLQEPAIAGSNTISLPASTGTVALTTDVIGVGQTWTDVTSSRALSTTYTNSTGKPIMIAINGSMSSGSGQMVVTIAGLAMTVAYSGSGYSNASGQFIIPNGAAYAVSGINNLQYWYELR